MKRNYTKGRRNGRCLTHKMGTFVLEWNKFTENQLRMIFTSCSIYFRLRSNLSTFDIERLLEKNLTCMGLIIWAVGWVPIIAWETCTHWPCCCGWATAPVLLATFCICTFWPPITYGVQQQKKNVFFYVVWLVFKQ